MDRHAREFSVNWARAQWGTRVGLGPSELDTGAAVGKYTKNTHYLPTVPAEQCACSAFKPCGIKN